MKRLFIIVISIISLLDVANAQGIRIPGADKTRDASAVKKPSNQKDTTSRGLDLGLGRRPEDKNRTDTLIVYTDYLDSVSVAYYQRITKRHGWMVGVGKSLSLDEAKHLSCYFRLSMKNRAGNWTRIEAFDGYGDRTTSHSIGTYIVNQGVSDDRGANQEWVSRLKDVCQWEFIGDASGRHVLQERAFDQYGNAVYYYNPVKTGERTYTGSYVDGNGMPVFMRADSLGYDIGYANFVHVLRDERGYDVKISFTDRFGYPQVNKDGAYQTLYEYDDAGNQIREASLNIAGEYMIDNYGNCGWDAEYEDNHQVEARYFNADGDYIQMPLLRENSEKVYGFRYKYDDYGRNIERMVIGKNAEPDTNQFGVHKVKWEFNDHGYYTSQRFYDLDGNLHPGTKDGIAQIICEYDDRGRPELIEYKDPLGRHVNNTEDPDNVYCRREMTFMPDYQESQTDFIAAADGSLVKEFEYRRDSLGNTVKKWYQDDLQKIDSVDFNGRSILEAWYHLDGSVAEDAYGLHRRVERFDDDRNMSTEKWMDKEGELLDYDDQGYSESVSYYDDDNWTITNYQYLYGILFQSFTKKFTDGYGDIVAQWDVTPYGEHARVGWWNNLHYVCDVEYTAYGDIKTMIGKNEFGEPSYLTFLGASGEVYYISNINNGQRKYYDEYGKEIPDSTMSAFKETLPMAYCIEVTDTTIAYPLGLRNGDIIISYGDWRVNEDLKTDMEYFYLEAIKQATSAKSITLLRHHPEQSYSEILDLDLPYGKTSELGFYPHKIYYTAKEKNRLLNTCKAYDVSLGYDPQGGDKEILLGVPTKGSVISTRLYHLPGYSMKDPSVVLYAKEKYKDRYDTWSMLTDPVEAWNDLQMFYISGSNIYFTEDLCSSRHILKDSRGYGGMRVVPVMVSEHTYNQIILNCYETLGDEIWTGEDIEIGPSIKLTKKNVLGEWLCKTDKGVEVRLTVRKNGEADFSCAAKYHEELPDYGIGINLSLDLSADGPGSWKFVGSEMEISFDTTFTCRPKDISFTGTDDEELTSQLVKLIELMDWSDTYDMDSIAEDLKNATVKNLTQTHMVLYGGYNEYVFVRQ